MAKSQKNVRKPGKLSLKIDDLKAKKDPKGGIVGGTKYPPIVLKRS